MPEKPTKERIVEATLQTLRTEGIAGASARAIARWPDARVVHRLDMATSGLVLMARGAWQQTLINWDSTSAVMQASMAWFYVSGLLFAVLAGLIVLLELLKFATGRLEESQLVGVIESNDVPHGQPQPVDGPATR